MLRSQAYSASQNKDWFGAAQYYSRLYDRDSSDIKVQYKYADASRLNFDVDLAFFLYMKVVTLDNGKRYPLTFYWLGHLLKNKGQYKEAKKWFVKFSKLNLKKDKYSYYKIKSKIESEACDIAQILIKNPINIPIEHLDVNVNSKLSEYGAFEKDSSLYFSSIRGPERKNVNSKKQEVDDMATRDVNQVNYSKIYKADIKNAKWKKAKALDANFNAANFHNANTCFSADFKQMVISRCRAKNGSEFICDLFISTLVKNKWTVPLQMEAPINQPSVSTTQPNFGEIDGKSVLFFSSDRAGGEGGMDIWYSFKNSDGSFNEPVNVGKKINTPDDEVTPWFVSEKNTLYFSSTWHKGLGGFDIFKSSFKSNEFSDPTNAGYPINSSYNDIYYSENESSAHVYLSSNRVGSFFEGKLNCCNDIYRFNIDTLQPAAVYADTIGIVKEQLKLLVPLTLYFHNDEPDPKRMSISTTKNYETTYNDYKLLIPTYVKEYTKGLKGDKKDISENKIQNFFSDSLDSGLDDLHRFTDMLVKVLANKETVKITMKGYCSPLASNVYNTNLAKRRISSLRNYFSEVKDGLFIKYIDNQMAGEGKIIFEDVDVGELPVSKASDDFKDKRNSVYSPFAASERKIQIIAVSFGSQ